MAPPHNEKPATALADDGLLNPDHAGRLIEQTSTLNRACPQTNLLAFLAAEINAEYRAAHGAAEKALHHAAECGRRLIEAKALVPHGEWLAWLEANTEVVPRQSQKYMRLAEGWEV